MNPSTTELMDVVLSICEKIDSMDAAAYIVGGAARDRYLTLLAQEPFEPKDIDLEVFGLTADQLIRLLQEEWRIDVVGKSFGVIKIHGYPIDISIPRREIKTGDTHTSFEIALDPHMSMHEAASRRDFTVNALYFDPLTGIWFNAWNGRRDLREKRLHPISERFAEDPLRVLRGMQMIARFDLTPSEECLRMCRGLSQKHLARERVWEEWKKLLLKGKHIRKALGFLNDIGWLENYYPELFALIGSEQTPEWHPEGDVFEHTALVVEAFTRGTFENDEEKLVLGLAALCHDMGKPATAVFGPTKRKPAPHWTNHGHEFYTGPAERFLMRLTNETKIIEQVLALCRTHMAPSSFYHSDPELAAFRRLAQKVPIKQLTKLLRFDQGGRGPTLPPDEEMISWFEKKAAKAGVQHAPPKPIVLGRDLIAQFQYPAGEEMGKLLAQLMEKQLSGEFETKEAGLKIAEQLIRENTALQT